MDYKTRTLIIIVLILIVINCMWANLYSLLKENLKQINNNQKILCDYILSENLDLMHIKSPPVSNTISENTRPSPRRDCVKEIGGDKIKKKEK